MSEVVYLYGFVPLDGATSPAELAGVSGREVELVETGGFAAAVSRLPADEFGADAVQDHLGSLRWVAEHGAAHERVVTWLADHTTVVPARLFTIFSTEAALLAEALTRAEAIRTALSRFRDLREWDVKVSYDADALAGHLAAFSEEIAELDEHIATAAPGRRYLLGRKRDETAARTAADVALEQARRYLQELAPRAEEVVELEVPGRRQDLPVVLNAALLVRTGQAAALASRAAELGDVLEGRGIHASLTGPWAPYRFMGDPA